MSIIISEAYVYKGHHLFKYRKDNTIGTKVDGNKVYHKNIMQAVLYIDNLENFKNA